MEKTARAIKLSFVCSEQSYDAMKYIANKCDISVAEVLRHAMELEEFFFDQLHDGGDVVIHKGDYSHKVVGNLIPHKR